MNPYNRSLTSGGSSGGEGALVGTRICFQNAQSYANVDKALRGSPIGDSIYSIYYIMMSESNLPQVWGRT
jgi:hypothetical protein